jgi:hypothetical protein
VAAAADPFSYDSYAEVLAEHVDAAGRVDYQALKANREPLDAFSRVMANLDPATYKAWSEQARLAFWINAYNAYTLMTIINHYPIEPGGLISRFRFPANSIRQIDGVWDELEWDVMGMRYTLDQMEHDILRKEFSAPRMHMAIVCASIGCPYLRDEPYVAEKLDDQLADQSRRFLSSQEKGMRADVPEEVLYLSPIFDWFGEDFTMAYGTTGVDHYDGNEAAVLNFVAHHVDDAMARWIREGAYSLRYLDYDWGLNDQK